ncbi:ribonuclease III [Kyrpidia tusciae]|uniref:Ribonuclease 3 n=1 Tax=Kyrpidia tusciae (strain DSM 2912 / NBRC 15312 / T2) TaxID=562970 RepID=D5WPA0_KYRT2|nr:ribonuclease III [Kyrpidia tusciae]ADG06159.1 ribonuclease III [Kyrpidia tusciae DSM 2912]
MATKWDELEARLGITFRNASLLRQAFTHSSYRNEHRGDVEDNERLEFLGDAVLELLVSEFLFRAYPRFPEGELTRMRAAIVCEPSLVRFATALGLDQYIRLGRGEEMSGGRRRPSLLADVYEALIGAIFLDQGLEAAREFLQRMMFPALQREQAPILDDYKTMLQEHVQKVGLGPLTYRITDERGPAHHREFVAQVWIGGQAYGEGSGRSKKEAEQHAAREALMKLTALPS